jgi:hypothetical protein
VDGLVSLRKLTKLNTKHTNICFKAHFSILKQPTTSLYTTGFDYKFCHWNISDVKKSVSTSLQSALTNIIGEQAMCYNPPFCYAINSFLTNNDTVEHLVLGLGNGGIARYRKNGLKLEEYADMVHRA